MKNCPTCNLTYADDTLSFCLQDGTSLVDSTRIASQMPTEVLGESETVVRRGRIVPDAWEQSQVTRVALKPRADSRKKLAARILTGFALLIIFGFVAAVWFLMNESTTKGSVSRDVSGRDASSSASPTVTPVVVHDDDVTPLGPIQTSEDLISKVNTRGRPTRGNPEGKLVMIVFINFQDPYSARTHTVLLPKLLEGYGSRLRIIYKDLPLTALHVWAMHAAIDANCLLQQSSDSYWEFADHVFRSQKTIGGNSRAEAFLNLDLDAMRIGDQRGLDIPRLQACVNNSDETNVRASIREADQLGIDSTPTFFINDEIVVGANEDQLRASIDRNLASPD